MPRPKSTDTRIIGEYEHGSGWRCRFMVRGVKEWTDTVPTRGSARALAAETIAKAEQASAVQVDEALAAYERFQEGEVAAGSLRRSTVETRMSRLRNALFDGFLHERVWDVVKDRFADIFAAYAARDTRLCRIEWRRRRLAEARGRSAKPGRTQRRLEALEAGLTGEPELPSVVSRRNVRGEAYRFFEWMKAEKMVTFEQNPARAARNYIDAKNNGGLYVPGKARAGKRQLRDGHWFTFDRTVDKELERRFQAWRAKPEDKRTLLSFRTTLSAALAHSSMMRAGEIVSRRVSSFVESLVATPEGRLEVLRIFIEEDQHGGDFQVKTDERREHVVMPWYRHYVEALMEGQPPDAFLFASPSSKTGHLWTSAVNQEVKRLCRLAGVEEVCTQALRGGTNTTMIDAGMQIATMARLCGHSIKINKGHYTKPGAGEVARVMQLRQ